MNANTNSDWTQGYRSDVEYTHGYYPFMRPDMLMLTAVLQGFRPPSSIVDGADGTSRKLAYCELGSGQGLSLNVMAANDPGGIYVGVDFNPTQVSNAQHFAAAAQLKNITYYEESFEFLDRLNLPSFDVISLHGIWSWVAREVQAAIVEFLRSKLKPGGLCFMSYNTGVGRAIDWPVRELLLLASRSSAETGAKQAAEAVSLANDIATAGARYFKQVPLAAQRLAGLKGHSPNYVRHEYMHDTWHLDCFHDVAAALTEAKLSYVGSVDMVQNRTDLVLPAEAQPFLKRFSGEAEREFLKDLWTGNTFRKDLFVKGAKRLNDAEIATYLRPLRFALARTRENCKLEIAIPMGTGMLVKELFEPVLDRLAKGPATGEELEAIAKKTNTSLKSTIQLLIASGHGSLCTSEKTAPKLAQNLAGLDSAIAAAVDGGADMYLASQPGQAKAAQLGMLDYLLWRFRDKPAKQRAEASLAILEKLDKQIIEQGKPVADKARALAIMEAKSAEFDKLVLPVLTAGL